LELAVTSQAAVVTSTTSDLYNVSSVRLAEATRVKLYLPGLGGELYEEEADDCGPQRGSGKSEESTPGCMRCTN
jgi:hypothetical protein